MSGKGRSYFFLLLLFVFCFSQIQAQSTFRTMNAVRITEAPKIDGQLNEDVWSQAQPATDFIENSPNPFEPSEQKTEIRILYDDKALYIGAFMFDNEPDKILKQLSIRDDQDVNADRIEIIIDPFAQGQNAWLYGLTAAGVQQDATLNLDETDFSWEGNWTSKVKRNDQGWVAELRIPYAAIRFPDRDIQRWGINFKRIIRRSREQSFWNPVDPGIDGLINQFGILEGIEKVKPPVRLSFTPFLVASAQNRPTDNRDESPWRSDFSGGLDIKYGINESITLDMTLIPDFGQVQFDEVVLNLGPFELFFEERRPFFTEGVELFNRSGLFFSRRIGDTPIGFGAVSADAAKPDDERQILRPGEKLIDNPANANLLNAVKISGRNRKGLGVGFFNAVTGNTNATVEFGEGIFREIQTNPLTNYNVIVLDQQFANNSYVTFTNTNVIRANTTEFGSNPGQDANVTGSQVRFANKKNTYAILANGSISQTFNKNDEDDLVGSSGFTYGIELSKVSGKVVFDLGRYVESDTYNPNDLGFLFANNEVTHYGEVRIREFQPKGKLNSYELTFLMRHQNLYEPTNQFSEFFMRTGGFVVFKSFFATGAWINTLPVAQNDFFEARTIGQKFVRPGSYEFESFISSDYRKAFAIDISGNISHTPEFESIEYLASIRPRIRVSDRLIFFPNFTLSNRLDERGFTTFSNDEIIFARRDRRDITTALTANLLFNENMNVTLRGRHNWALVENKEFFSLNQDGGLDPTAFNENQDINFNIFNIDLVYRWRFAPSSEINLIWKNVAFSNTNLLDYNYFSNFSDLFDNDQTNTFTFKILYFLDYQDIKRSNRDPSILQN